MSPEKQKIDGKLITLPSGKQFYDPENGEDRFLKKITKSDSGCWIWIGAKTRGGYGHIGMPTPEGRKMLRAHVYAHWHFNGGVGYGTDVMHSCDNPSCVNPDHLSLGTKKENQADSISKGRSARGSSSAPKSSKQPLNEEIVRDIRYLSTLGYKQRWIADLVGVHFANVSRVLNRQTWGWVENV